MDVYDVKLTESDVPGASLKQDDVACHTVDELKRWLQCHGLKITGEQKLSLRTFGFIFG